MIRSLGNRIFQPCDVLEGHDDLRDRPLLEVGEEGRAVDELREEDDLQLHVEVVAQAGEERGVRRPVVVHVEARISCAILGYGSVL